MERAVATVMTSTTDPGVHRARCLLCTWASHPGGAPESLAVLAVTAHLEAAHNVRQSRRIPLERGLG